jgi:streptomycin 6-kinase
MADDLDLYLRRWRLTPEGEPFETLFSRLCFVRGAEGPAVLKLLKPGSDETAGAAMLGYYGGEGAVRLLRAEGAALLVERATGSRSLTAMARAGDDIGATAILAAATQRLLMPRAAPPPPGLEPLEQRFAPLLQSTDRELQTPATVAHALLAAPLDRAVLHGDLHHENLLDGGSRGWLAIDPKGVLGERSYEAANILCNPSSASAFVLRPERFLWQAKHFSDSLQVDSQRMLGFALAHAGLAVCWSIMDGTDPGHWRACTALLAPLVDGAAA